MAGQDRYLALPLFMKLKKQFFRIGGLEETVLERISYFFRSTFCSIFGHGKEDRRFWCYTCRRCGVITRDTIE